MSSDWISAAEAFAHVLLHEMNPHVVERRILEAIAEQALPAKGTLRDAPGGGEYFLPAGFCGSIDFEQGRIEQRKPPVFEDPSPGANTFTGGITWVDVEYDERCYLPDHPNLDNVAFSRKHLFALWPETDAVMVQTTGAPGRPTSQHRVLDELDRRAKLGIIENTLAAEARHLSRWLGSLRPREVAMKATSIENTIRDPYRAAKNTTK